MIRRLTPNRRKYRQHKSSSVISPCKAASIALDENGTAAVRIALVAIGLHWWGFVVM